ncbi:NAD(P)-dependent alcohol dehydrogenase [Fodinicola feengrottensis]|nr:NAD(P)-dependent alcohol dehydrogenase [Fodinicola feengrottensis]
MVQDTYGSPDVLEFRDIDKPPIGADEVLVRVRAAGVDPGVWHLMAGQPYLLRVIGFGLRAPKVRVRGRDVAGSVEAVGENVTDLRVGAEVFGICEGSFAEYASVRADKCAPMPASLRFDQAAAVPVSGITALRALRDAGQVRAGQRVLVVGAAGGVGTFAVQLAKTFGAHVTGVCSTTKVDLVRSLGADETIDYTREDFTDRTGHFDLILDIAGNRPLSRLRRSLAPRGTLVIVGGEGRRWLGGMDRLLRAVVLSMFLSQHLRGVFPQENREDLMILRELIEDRKITPVIDRTYALAETPDAIRYVHKGHASGKVVVVL